MLGRIAARSLSRKSVLPVVCQTRALSVGPELREKHTDGHKFEFATEFKVRVDEITVGH
jgi:hypothetical protein